MAAMRFEQVQRFISAKKIFWGYGHFKLKNSRSCLQYQTIAGYESFYTAENFRRRLFDLQKNFSKWHSSFRDPTGNVSFLSVASTIGFCDLIKSSSAV